jgi:predicted ArsR family transcriptional regulator
MRDGYLRGALSRLATRRQTDALAAFVAAGGSVADAAALVGIRPSTVKRHLADLDARERVPHHATCYLRWSDGTFVPS